jgi:hypothetical protein
MFFRITTNIDTADKNDFDSTVEDVTFQPGETGPKLVEIRLVDDSVDESREKFTVFLSSNSSAIMGGPSSVNIEDDDGYYFLMTLVLQLYVFHILRFVSYDIISHMI